MEYLYEINNERQRQEMIQGSKDFKLQQGVIEYLSNPNERLTTRRRGKYES